MAKETDAAGDAILIAGFGGIGDHVRCFGLARHVAEQFPGRPIDFLCRSPVDRLVPFVPDLRNAFVDDTPHRRLGLAEKLRLARRLRQQRYGRVYVVSRTLKAALIPFLAGIPERVGWLGEGRIGLITHVRSGEGEAMGETEKVCALARADARGPFRFHTPRMAVPQAMLAQWQRSTLGASPGAPVLALAPGAYNVLRQWPVSHFADVARFYAARGWQVWVLGGPKEREMAAAIGAVVPVRDFTDTPLEEAVLQLASSTLFLGNDSGMLHIAGALGTRSVGLFGPTALEVTGPRNACVSGVRPPQGSIDVREIPVDWVLDALGGRAAQAA